jgi:manganese efflux pump family protein
VLAFLLVAGCSAASGPQRATAQSCYEFGVQAIERHETVLRLPAACAGLTQEQVNIAIVRAIRDVVGPRPKAAARRAAYRESRYLFHLAGTVKPAKAVVPVAVPPLKSSDWPLKISALIAWIATVLAGAYLLVGFLRGTTQGLGRTRLRAARLPPVLIIHFGLALTGLVMWIAFVATRVTALAWICVGVLLPVAGLGMATLVGGGGGPEPDDAGSAPRGASRPPVIMIALHGALATVTILLVLLAAIGAQ